MGCRLCSQDSDETHEHLQLCEGTKFHDWEGLESVPLLTLLAVGSFSFVAGGIV